MQTLNLNSPWYQTFRRILLLSSSFLVCPSFRLKTFFPYHAESHLDLPTLWLATFVSSLCLPARFISQALHSRLRQQEVLEPRSQAPGSDGALNFPTFRQGMCYLPHTDTHTGVVLPSHLCLMFNCLFSTRLESSQANQIPLGSLQGNTISSWEGQSSLVVHLQHLIIQITAYLFQIHS